MAQRLYRLTEHNAIVDDAGREVVPAPRMGHEDCAGRFSLTERLNGEAWHCINGAWQSYKFPPITEAQAKEAAREWWEH